MYSCALLTSLSGRGASYRLITIITRFLSVPPLNPTTDLDYRARGEAKSYAATNCVAIKATNSVSQSAVGTPGDCPFTKEAGPK